MNGNSAGSGCVCCVVKESKQPEMAGGKTSGKQALSRRKSEKEAVKSGDIGDISAHQKAVIKVSFRDAH